MGGSRTRRTAAITLLLVTVGAAGAAAVAWKLKPDSAAYWGSAIGGVYGLAALYLTWASYRDDRAAEAPAPKTLAEVADQLAIAVHNQWAAEVELRRLNDPYALPVRWEAAPVDLVEDWAAIERLATGGGAGWPPPPPSGTWATDPTELAGTNRELADVLGRIPTGRLAVLGEPGAGKTILLARLAIDLLPAGRRGPSGPVPVLLSVASWDPTGQRLDDWVESRLVADYPGLAEPAPDDEGKTRARRLWEAGLLLLLLDGLDEIPDAVRGTAVAKINEGVPPGQRLVVTSRTDPYQDALHPPGGVEVRLTGAAGIQLRPLRPHDVADYLRDSAGGPTAATRWDPVLATFTQTPNSPAAQALTTPLMTSLARAVYNPRPGEPATAVGRSPTELLDPVRFPTRTSLEQHLFDGYLPAAYRPHPDPAEHCRWSASQAERWLVFLARHLEHTLSSTPDFAWWQLPRALSPRHQRTVSLLGMLAAGLAIGLTTGLALGVTGSRFAFGLAFALMDGLLGGFGFGLAFVAEPAEEDRVPRRAMRWHSTAGLLAACLGGALVGQLATLLLGGFAGGLMAGFAVALAVGLAYTLVYGLSTMLTDLTQAASPTMVLRQDRATFRSLAFVVGLAIGPAFGLMVGLAGNSPILLWQRFEFRFAIERMGRLAFGLTSGLACGLMAGLMYGLAKVPWGMFALTRTWLAVRGQLPRDLMAFLADAHQRGVLRQVGAVYQFRHIELQRRLANR